MMDGVRARMRRLEAIADAAKFAGQVVNRTGLLGSLSPSGMARFARELRGAKPGPHTTLLLHACNKPQVTAIADDRRRLTFEALHREANQLAHGLASLGVQPGDRVAVMMRNCVEYVVVGQALARKGATAVQVGYRLKPKEITHVLDNSKPKAAIFHRDYAAFMSEARDAAGYPSAEAMVVTGGRSEAGVAYEDFLRARDGNAPPSGGYSDRGGVMIYTSGTTGKPKGAHRRMRDTSLVAVGDFMMQIGVAADERHLIVCPLYHSGAMAFFTFTFSLGATNLIMDHFDPKNVLEVIARERVTSAFMVPTMLARIAALDEATRARYDTSSLRWVCSGAAPLPTETARRFQAAFGDILWNFYGATETGLVSLAGPRDHTARPGTIGRLLRGVEVSLRGDDGRDVPVGEVGELWVRSGMTLDGYHDNPEASAKARRADWFSVGDMARMDRDGYLYMASRKSDMVISGGMNIYPREIEDHLCEHPAVLECAVIGVPDDEWGESLKAFVVVRDGARLTAEEIIAHCREGLADYKRPRQVVFLDALPRNPTGKVLKRELRGEP